MNKASIFELRDNLASYLSEVAKTERPLVIYKYKKPIAVIVPPKKSLIDDDYKQFFGFMGKGRETGMEYENRIRRNKRERAYIRNLRNGKT